MNLLPLHQDYLEVVKQVVCYLLQLLYNLAYYLSYLRLILLSQQYKVLVKDDRLRHLRLPPRDRFDRAEARAARGLLADGRACRATPRLIAAAALKQHTQSAECAYN